MTKKPVPAPFHIERIQLGSMSVGYARRRLPLVRPLALALAATAAGVLVACLAKGAL